MKQNNFVISMCKFYKFTMIFQEVLLIVRERDLDYNLKDLSKRLKE